VSLPVAGDDPEAKRQVLTLVDAFSWQLGSRSVPSCTEVALPHNASTRAQTLSEA
jgi:hypothetical protein